MKKSVFIATSLDGFISRKNGEIDWLDAFDDIVPKGEDCGYNDFIKTIDIIIMGRNTFEKVLSFDVEWPYKQKVIVLSNKGTTIPKNLQNQVTTTSETPTDLCHNLEQQGYKHAYIDGGLTIQSFLKQNLIDDLTITTAPVLIGQGKTLFGAIPADIKLTHKNTTSYPFGFVQSKYEISKP